MVAGGGRLALAATLGVSDWRGNHARRSIGGGAAQRDGGVADDRRHNSDSGGVVAPDMHERQGLAVAIGFLSAVASAVFSRVPRPSGEVDRPHWRPPPQADRATRCGGHSEPRPQRCASRRGSIDEPTGNGCHTGDAETGDELNPDRENACAARVRVIGRQVCQRLQTHRGEDDRQHCSFRERPQFDLRAVNSPGTDTDSHESRHEKRGGDDHEIRHARIVARIGVDDGGSPARRENATSPRRLWFSLREKRPRRPLD